jgi:hypothetical protein
MYNAVASGFVVNASLTNAGSGYVVGDVLTISGGTYAGSGQMQITVDMVDVSGAIVDFHCSGVGSYSTYPALPAAVTGGTGAGAVFNLNFPAPDYYLNLSTPAAPVLYICTTAGSHATSVWAQVAGGTNTNTQFWAIATLSNTDYFIAYQLTIFYVTGVLYVALAGTASIAKKNCNRISVASALIDGETITYSSYTSDNYRFATDPSGNTEYEALNERFVTMTTLGYNTSSFPLTGTAASGFLNSQCVTKATYFQAGVGMLDASANQVYWEEAVDRKWTRNYIQSEGD